MAETKSKSKTVTCTLCDKPITTGKPVIIDDDPYHSDCAKAMEQSSGAADDADDEEEDEEAEEAEEEAEDGEDEGDEDEADEEEEEVPAPRTAKKVVAKAAVKRPVVVEDDDDEDDDDEEEEEEVVVARPAKKAAVVAKTKRAPVVVEDDDEDDEDDEEEEEVVTAKKAAVKAATKAVASKKRAPVVVDEDEEYEEEDEPEERPRKATKAKTSTNGTAKKKVAAVDTSGWGNPSSPPSKRYFVYQALKEVTKADLAVADGTGKPENAIKRAKRLHRDWSKETSTPLSDKDQNYTSMNIGWIYNHADELGLVMAKNDEAGTYRVVRAKAPTADDD